MDHLWCKQGPGQLHCAISVKTHSRCKFTVLYLSLPWFTVLYLSLPWFTLLYITLPWFTVLYLTCLLCFTLVYQVYHVLYHRLLYFTMVYSTSIYTNMAWLLYFTTVIIVGNTYFVLSS